jgi:hypothetical protein
MLDGWKIAARTDFRTSLFRESTGETLEILYHDSMQDHYDIHSLMYCPSQDSASFLVLHCDGLYEIDSSSFRVSPPPSPIEVAMREQPVTDQKKAAEFFQKTGEALSVLPNKDLVQAVLSYAYENPHDPYAFPGPTIAFLDLGCGNGRRVVSESGSSYGECVGVDFHPPIYNDCSNASFFRSEAGEFLRTLKQRSIQAERINADFLLGKLPDAERTFLLEKIVTRLSENGSFSFVENVAMAKKIVAVLKMFPGVSVQAKGFWESEKQIELTSVGRKAIEKFVQTHPEYSQPPAAKDGQNQADASRSVPASMPILVVALKTNGMSVAAGANDSSDSAAEEKAGEQGTQHTEDANGLKPDAD